MSLLKLHKRTSQAQPEITLACEHYQEGHAGYIQHCLVGHGWPKEKQIAILCAECHDRIKHLK